ncbi:histidine kinase [Kitasatospora sp. NPDC049285]|uniref:sensor histidine kinase n=1 Tax=Kitasatospora sp. NPDC049285 TaxID=3157096 RepID=UPI0034131AC6
MGSTGSAAPWRGSGARLRAWAAGPDAPVPVRRRLLLLDAALAGGFALVGLRYAVDPPNVPTAPWDLPVLAAAAALPPAWRRRAPLAALAAQLVLCVALLARHAYPDVLFVAALVTVVSLYSALAHSAYRRGALLAAPVASAVLLVLVDRAKLPHFPNWVTGALLLCPVAAAAWGHRLWAARTERGRARLRALERDRIEALRQAVEHERARIARELHDVVTHNVSVMVIQAGAARMVVERDPAAAKEALLAIEAGGRAAMTDMRNVMGLLTMDSPERDPATQAELAPQPGLDGLDALVGRMRAAGIDVALEVTGERRPLPPGVELTSYRLVQEALTNMVKHAVGARAEIRVDHGARELRVDVAHTEGRPGPAAATGGGRGLVGLRERVAVHGGTFHAGPRLTGGYRVKASIPLDDMVETPSDPLGSMKASSDGMETSLDSMKAPSDGMETSLDSMKAPSDSMETS